MLERFGGVGQFATSCLLAATGLVLANKGVYLGAAALSVSAGTGVSILAIAAGFAAASIGFSYGPKLYTMVKYGGLSAFLPRKKAPDYKQIKQQQARPSLMQRIKNKFNTSSKPKADVEKLVEPVKTSSIKKGFKL